MLITITTFLDPWEAHFFRLRLNAEGIPAFVADEHLISVNWPISLALGGVKVQVPVSAGDEARAIWKSCLAGKYEAELGQEFGIVAHRGCPTCGSERFRSRAPRALMILAILGGLLGGGIFRPGFSVHRCQVCGTEWSNEERE